jgi:hypothetical protein
MRFGSGRPPEAAWEVFAFIPHQCSACFAWIWLEKLVRQQRGSVPLFWCLNCIDTHKI